MDFQSIHSFEALQQQASALGVALISGDTALYRQPLMIEATELSNRLMIQPVEGFDSESDGTPGEGVVRRYLRYAKGGAGLIWFEAVALNNGIKGSPRQMVLHERNVGRYAELIDRMKEVGQKRNGYAPKTVIQMSHPGRAAMTPVPAIDSAVYDTLSDSAGQRALTDDEIASLADEYVAVTRLAKQAGFDGVEVKACHRFFISESLAAYDRPGQYGGSYENRTRHLKEALAAARSACDGMFLTSRINFYDGAPHPYGFGMQEGGGFSPDAAEPLRLISEINDEFGVRMVNLSSGSPAFSKFPKATGKGPLYSAPDHPAKNAARNHSYAAAVKAHIPEMRVAATSFSYCREYAAEIGAGLLAENKADIIGFGREALAYPDFARDILLTGGMKADCCCITCGACGRRMDAGQTVGCPVRDELFREAKKSRHVKRGEK
jgi:2,4-dienoyl-CoA reductase-like NADH-dependent reductase (Old Yellow Enzyme family)